MGTPPSSRTPPGSATPPTIEIRHRLPLERTDARLADLIGLARGNAVLDRVAYGLSEVANHSLLWHGINLVDLTLSATRGDRTRCRRALRRSVIQGVEQALVNGPLKATVKRQRPVGELHHPHRLRVPVTSSFPSGHATAGACAAELLGTDLGHRRAWWALAAVIGWSRIHVGVHHPSDVLAGWLFGAAAARASRVLWPPARCEATGFHGAATPQPPRDEH